jgi:glycosyltransferase involved in cell wall biosynthesis
MKILIVSINSIHTSRWYSQFKNNKDFDFFYFDINGKSKPSSLGWIEKDHVDWEYKISFMKNLRGRFFLKRVLGVFFDKLFLNQRALEFEKVLEKYKPDVVHSLILDVCCTPILDVMLRHKGVKWIYSAWGSDLFFNQNIPHHLADIKRILPRLDYMFADCERDIEIAKKFGFKGTSLGAYPGGGGFHIKPDDEIKNISQKNGIIIKGYQSQKQQAINILKALKLLEKFPLVTVFSANVEVVRYIKDNFKDYKHKFIIYDDSSRLPHEQMMTLFNNNKYYISNNYSDGMPNTLLEAICNCTFPIQSNPGGASAEIINDYSNGLLINDCDNILEIKQKIELALSDDSLIEKAFSVNKKLRHNLEYDNIRKQVTQKYHQIKNDLDY